MPRVRHWPRRPSMSTIRHLAGRPNADAWTGPNFPLLLGIERSVASLLSFRLPLLKAGRFSLVLGLPADRSDEIVQLVVSRTFSFASASSHSSRWSFASARGEKDAVHSSSSRSDNAGGSSNQSEVSGYRSMIRLSSACNKKRARPGHAPWKCTAGDGPFGYSLLRRALQIPRSRVVTAVSDSVAEWFQPYHEPWPNFNQQIAFAVD